MAEPSRWNPRTLAAQALGTVDPLTRAVVPPLHVATTFIRDPDNEYRSGYAYGRPDNATVRQTEAVIAALERAHEALVFGSGMAAATSVILAVPPGSRIVASQVMYWAFRRWLMNEGPRFGYSIEFVDTTDLNAVHTALKPATTLLYVETPGNPLWPISDIAALAEIAHATGAMLAVDFDLRDASVHAAVAARRRYRDAFGLEISQWPFRCHRGRARSRTRVRALGAHQVDPHPARRDSRAVRGLAPAARAAHARCARARAGGERCNPGRAALRSIHALQACFIRASRAIPDTPSRPAR